MELLANSGRDVICSIPFALLVQGNMARRKAGNAPAISQVGVAIATNTFSVATSLELSSFRTVRPKDTALRENNYESLQLAFRFAGDFTGVFTGGGFVVSASSLNLVVRAKETVELPDEKGVYSSPIARPQMVSNDIIVAGASNKVQYKLTPGQGLRSIVLKVTTNATPPVLSSTLLSRVRVNVGKVNRIDLAGTTILGEMSMEYPAAPPTGYYFLDFADRLGADDHLNDVLDLDPAQTMGADSMIEFDTSGACIISVMQLGYIPLAK